MGSHIGLFSTENDECRAALVAFYWAFSLIAFKGLAARAMWTLL